MKEFKMNSFWAINDSLEYEEARRQIDDFKSKGLTGIIFHPRNYTGSPAYLSIEYFNLVDRLILYCRQNEMDFWIYDENGWPSGSADGKVIQTDSGLRKSVLALDLPGEQSDQHTLITDYYDGQKKHKIFLLSEKLPSPMDKTAAEIFIHLTYEAYRLNLSKDAFGYLSGFFSDEVHLPASFGTDKKIVNVPWSETLPQTYFKSCGRSLIEDLPALFSNNIFSKSQTEKIRINFWTSCSAELTQNFYEPINNWCEKYNKRYIAHLKGEETPAFSVPFNGSPFQVLKAINLPAVDALERYPSNSYYPRIAASLADQFGDGNCFCEGQGGAGWGVSPQDFLSYFEWLMNCGINQFCLHISQYRLKAEAMRDWPPSTPRHLTWSEHFAEVMQVLKQKQKLFNQKTAMLVVVPQRGITAQYQPWEIQQTNEHNGSCPPDTLTARWSQEVIDYSEKLTDAGIPFHVCDERMLEENGVFLDGKIKVGKMIYTSVFADKHCRFTSENIGKEIEKISSFPVLKEKNPQAVQHYQEHEIEQSDWKIIPDDLNLLPFGENFFIGGSRKLTINLDEVMPIRLLATDALDSIVINGSLQHAVPIYKDDRYIYELHRDFFSKGKNLLEIYGNPMEQRPFCWLQGQFLVLAAMDDRKNGITRTAEVHLSLWNSQNINSESLGKNGLPFRFAPVRLEKSIEVPADRVNQLIHFDSLSCDGIEVELSGKKHFLWKGKDAPEIQAGKSGRINLKAKVYPSTFNANGPHHYLFGDYKVISPAQIEGDKNFADPLNAPQKTNSENMGFKDYGIGKVILKQKLD